MSYNESQEFIGLDKIDKPYQKYFIMIYKLNKNKKEKKKIIKEMKDGKYHFDNEKDGSDVNVIRIFGKYFIKENQNKSKIVYNNKKYELKEYFDEIDKNYNHEIKEIKLKLIGINNITNMKDMFHGCIHLSSVSESQKENQFKYNSYEIFSDDNPCSSLLEEINKENNNNIELNDEDKKSIDMY